MKAIIFTKGEVKIAMDWPELAKDLCASTDLHCDNWCKCDADFKDACTKALATTIDVAEEDRKKAISLIVATKPTNEEGYGLLAYQPIDHRFGFKSDHPYVVEVDVEIEYQYRTNHWTTIDKDAWNKYTIEERKRQVARLKTEKKLNSRFCIHSHESDPCPASFVALSYEEGCECGNCEVMIDGHKINEEKYKALTILIKQYVDKC